MCKPHSDTASTIFGKHMQAGSILKRAIHKMAANQACNTPHQIKVATSTVSEPISPVMSPSQLKHEMVHHAVNAKHQVEAPATKAVAGQLISYHLNPSKVDTGTKGCKRRAHELDDGNEARSVKPPPTVPKKARTIQARQSIAVKPVRKSHGMYMMQSRCMVGQSPKE
jgi:hypothetical protein